MRPNTTLSARRPRKRIGALASLIAAAVTCAMASAPAPAADPLPPPAAVDRVETLLNSLSLEERLGQVFMVAFAGPKLSPALARLITQVHIGGIVLFENAGNLQSIPQIAALTGQAQRLAVDQHGIGLFIAVDHEGGIVKRLPYPATELPSAMAIGAAPSAANAQAVAAVAADELRAMGINMNLAPVLDVNNNPDNPVIGVRSFGASAAQVAQLGVITLLTYQQHGIIATAKHFPGHGDTAVDSHYGLPVIYRNRAELGRVELLPFAAAAGAGVDAIMTAHILFPAIEPRSGLPATLSSTILQGMLRGDLGYDGLIVSDSMTMGALRQHFGAAQSAELAFRAGVDVLAFSGGTTGALAAYRSLLGAIKDSPELQARLAQSVRRILQVKARYGLLDWQPAAPDQPGRVVGAAGHQAAVRRVAQDSVTLVKNDGRVLPLDAGRPVLVIQVGGSDSLGRAVGACHTPTVSLTLRLDPSRRAIAALARQADGFDQVIVATANARSHAGQAELVRRLKDKRLAVVAVQEPYDLLAFPETPAYLATYGASTQALDAAAQVLCGRISPKGRLPVALPGLFPIGHGLQPW